MSSGSFQEDVGVLETVVDQLFDGKLVVSLVYTSETEYEDICKINDLPWLETIQLIYSHCEISYNDNTIFHYKQSDFFLNLPPETYLAPKIIKQLLVTAQQTKYSVIGPVRSVCDSLTWSTVSVQKIFHCPSITTISPELEEMIKAGEALAFINKKRISSSKVFVFHDYIAQSRDVAVPLKDSRKNLLNEVELYRSRSQVSVPVQKEARFTKQKKGCSRPFVWLFGERRGLAYEENGRVLFEYCKEVYPDIEAYYVVKQDVDIKIPSKYKNYIIRKGSDRWRAILSRATHFFFNDSALDILEGKQQLQQFSDVIYVFLTHGVLQYGTGTYVRNHQYFDLICVGVIADTIYGHRDWKYQFGAFAVTGLARWDKLLARPKRNQKEILFCPTWRKRLDKKDWNTYSSKSSYLEAINCDPFIEKYGSFLTSEPLAHFLKTNDMTLIVSVHFRIKEMLEMFFGFVSERIVIKDDSVDSRTVQQLMVDSCLLITDYSSLMWDMAYMGKPVICYQFDKELVLWERNLDSFNLKDPQLFADVCYSEREVVEKLEKYSNSQFELDVNQKIVLEELFGEKGNHCKRIMEKVVAEHNVTVCGESYFSFPQFNPLSEKKFVGKTVATIISQGVVPPDLAVELLPGSWQKQLLDIQPDIIVVEPHLDASSEWANIFYSQDKTEEFISTLVAFSLKNGFELIGLKNPITNHMFFQKKIEHELDLIELPYDYKEDAFDITIIIPVYNCEQHLRSCIDSVLNQTFHGTTEIVLVNDSSPDGVQDIIDDYISKNSNIKCITQPNMRQGMARNHGLMVAEGEFVTFVDSDDILPEDALATLHTKILLTKADVSLGLVCSVDQNYEKLRINQSYFHYSKAPSIINNETWPSLFIDPSSVGKLISRRFLFENKTFFPQSYWEDQFFCIQLFMEAEKISVTKEIVYYYVGYPVDNKESGTQTFSSEKFQQILNVTSLCLKMVSVKKNRSKQLNTIKRFLLRRIGRFVYKYTNNFVKQLMDYEVDLLRTFLSHYSSQELSYAVEGELFFKALKKGKSEIDYDLKYTSALSSSSFDYFKPFYLPVSSTVVCGQDTYVRSFKYRLGDVFVRVARKEKWAILKVPVRLTVLFIDLISVRGLWNGKKTVTQSKADPNVSGTAAYCLGVLLIDCLKRPNKLLRLYRDIRELRGRYS